MAGVGMTKESGGKGSGNFLALSCCVDQVLVGEAKPFGPNGELSAIEKLPVAGPVEITSLGIKGDQQADNRFHGGAAKAIHQFPAEHYQSLASVLPNFPGIVGGFGENLSTIGMTENDVCLGDLFRLGEVVLRLSQGRQPCWKLNVRFNHPDMATMIQAQGWTGWYYSVEEEGVVTPGDRLILVERPYPQANLASIQHYLYRDTLNAQAMEQILQLPVLPQRWRNTFEQRIKTGVKESDAVRVVTPVTAI